MDNFSNNRRPMGPISVGQVGFPWKILLVSIIVFGLTILIYFGMAFGYTAYLNSQISQVEAEFEQISKLFDENQQKDLLDFYSQLYNIQSLSNNHPKTSRFFSFLQESTYPSTRLTLTQINTLTGEGKIEGLVDSFDSLSLQLSSFKSNTSVTDISLDSSRLREPKEGGGVVFSAKIMMNKKFFTNGSLNN